MPVLILEPQQEVDSEASEQPKREGEGRHMLGSLRLFIHLGGHLPRDRPCCNVSSLLQGLPVCPETLPYTSALDQLCETRGKDPASGAPFAHSRPLKDLCANDPRHVSLCQPSAELHTNGLFHSTLWLL